MTSTMYMICCRCKFKCGLTDDEIVLNFGTNSHALPFKTCNKCRQYFKKQDKPVSDNKLRCSKCYRDAEPICFNNILTGKVLRTCNTCRRSPTPHTYELHMIDHKYCKYIQLDCIVNGTNMKSKVFKYNVRNFADVLAEVHQRIDAIRKSSPCGISTTEQVIEQSPQLTLTQPTPITETSIAFYIVDYVGRVKLGYSINNNKRTYKFFKYTHCGVDTVKNRICEFMNSIRSTNGLDARTLTWDGWNFTYDTC